MSRYLLIPCLLNFLLMLSGLRAGVAETDGRGPADNNPNPNVNPNVNPNPTAIPSAAAAEANAFRVFNSVRAAMRQWPSSVDHNGFAIVPAVVPAGTLLYHGSLSPDVPATLEWLAFEIEHSTVFGTSFRPGWHEKPPHPPHMTHEPKPAKHPMQQRLTQHPRMHQMHPMISGWGQAVLGSAPDDAVIHGYKHIYRVRRDLRLLYLDGMSAGNSNYGNLDTTDFVLRAFDPTNSSSLSFWQTYGDRDRAVDLCAMAAEFGVQGFIRMELGFEVILCDFGPNVDLISARRQPQRPENIPGGYRTSMAEYILLHGNSHMRDESEQFGGIGSGRVALDFSAMTSALWLTLDGDKAASWNTSTWNSSRPDLERVGSATTAQLAGMRTAARDAALASWQRLEDGDGMWRRGRTVDWQGVVDMIVARYDKRIAILADRSTSVDVYIVEVSGVFDMLYIDWPASDDSDLGPPERPGPDSSASGGLGFDLDGAMDRCEAHYLLPLVASPFGDFTAADEAIRAAITAVLRTICSAFLRARQLLSDAFPSGQTPTMPFYPIGDELPAAIEASRTVFQELQRQLRWASWSLCGACKIDEICFVAAFPLGTAEDYFRPGCRSQEHVKNSWWRYWMEWVNWTDVDWGEK